jgi:hypothetical protein
MHVGRYYDVEGFSIVTIQYRSTSDYHSNTVYDLVVKSACYVVFLFEEDYLGLPLTRAHSPFNESSMPPGGTWHHISVTNSSPSN